ncbi:hypothetical protein [Bacillus spizizenii]
MKEQQTEETNALSYPLQNTLTTPMRKHTAKEKDSAYMSPGMGKLSEC